MLETIAISQAIYYFLTGAWSLLHIESLMAITGRDIWLIKTIGILIIVIGVSLFVAVLNLELSKPIFVLGIGSATSFACIDFYYVARRIISKVYLLDAFAQGIIIILWLIS